MTFRFKILAATALIALPAVAGANAQVTGSRVNPGVNTAAETEAEAVADQEVAAAQAEVAAEAEAQASTEAAPTPAQPTTPTAAETPAPPAAEASTTADASTATTAQAGAVTAATAADLRAGIEVHDPAGALVGTVESVDAQGAVVATGNVRAKLPVASFGKNDHGLVISMTRTQLEAAARAQSPS